jgi:hypothetical protein
MPTARVTANIAVQPLINVPLHQRMVVDAINVNNQGSSGTIRIQLQDAFTQDVANGPSAPAGPTVRTAFPFDESIGQGVPFSADKLSLEDMLCLGNVGIICDKTDAGCSIVVVFHLE